MEISCSFTPRCCLFTGHICCTDVEVFRFFFESVWNLRFQIALKIPSWRQRNQCTKAKFNVPATCAIVKLFCFRCELHDTSEGTSQTLIQLERWAFGKKTVSERDKADFPGALQVSTGNLDWPWNTTVEMVKSRLCKLSTSDADSEAVLMCRA